MRILFIVALVALLSVTVVVPAQAVQRASVTCGVPATGDAATGYVIEREAGNTAGGAWDATKASVLTTITTLPPAAFVDRTGSTGVPYRFRCTAQNAAGAGAPSDPSASVTLVGVPGKAGVTVIIITE